MLWLLHGNLGSPADWKPVMEFLRAGGVEARALNLWRYLECCPKSLKDMGRVLCSEIASQDRHSTLLRTTLIVGPGAVILGLLILVFHLTRPWTFWKLMFHYSFTSVMSMGVMLFQLYMVVLVLWLAKIFEHDLLALQHGIVD